MTLPLPANTTCDIYRAGVVPPAAPAVSGVACFLSSNYLRRLEVGEVTGNNAMRFTHILIIDVAIDIRDDQAFMLAGMNINSQETVYIPDSNGTRFGVVWVERRNRGTALEHKRVYLDRYLPNWPTNDL